MFNEPKNLYDADEMRKLAEGRLGLAREVESCVESGAWKLFRAVARRREIDVLHRDDYATLEDFRADRAGLKMLKDAMREFESYAEDADEAIELINQLAKAEDQTPLYLSQDLSAREEG